MKITIKTKIIALLLIFIVSITFFSMIILNEKSKISTDMKKLNSITELSVKISSVVHELQKERGRTSGFMGSKGEKFRDELTQQRKETDIKIQELNIYLQTYKYAENDKLEKSLEALSELENHRDKVDRFSIADKDGLGYYTSTIDTFIGSISDYSKDSNNAQITKMMDAYIGFLKAKEKTGIERAVGTNAFSSNKFADGMYLYYVSLISSQDSYIDMFKSNAEKDETEFYNMKMQNDAILEVQNMREIALSKANSGNFSVDSAKWFDSMTVKINLMKEVEDKLSENMLDRSKEIRTDAQNAYYFYLSVTIASIIIAILLSILVLRSILRPINNLTNRLKDIAEGEGDLTKKIEVDSEDEMKELASWFNKFIDKIKNTMVKVNFNVNSAAATAEELSASSEEVNASIQQVANTIQEIAKGNQNLSKNVFETKQEVESLINSVKNVTQSVDESTKSASEVNEISKTGAENAKIAAEKIKSIKDTVASSAMIIDQLGEKSKQINNVVEVINNISEQTNLLALNAAIEAARAGDAGRGFAVVADEVRKLAEESQKATKQIEIMIADISKNTQQAVDSMTKGTKEVDESSKIVNEALGSLHIITDKISNVTAQIKQINATSSEQMKISEKVQKSMNDVSAISEESAAGAEEISANIEETTSGMQNVAKAAQDLAKSADELRLLVAQFKLDHK